MAEIGSLGSTAKNYLDYLLDHSSNPIPTSDVAEVDFVNRFLKNVSLAAGALENLVGSITNGVSHTAIPQEMSEMGVYAEFAVTGHGDTETNATGKLTGHSGGMLSEKGREFAGKQGQEINDGIVHTPGIILSSDLPRAIEHALVKFANLNAEEEKELDRIRGRVNLQEGISPTDYDSLVTLAVNNSIFPTSLARAQFYGSLELAPEKFEISDLNGKKYSGLESLDSFVTMYESLKTAGNLGKVKPALAKVIDGFKAALGSGNEKEVEFYRRLYTESTRRSDMTISRGEPGTPQDENRFLLYHRALTLFSVFYKLKEKMRGAKVEVVAHSGFVDVALAYFDSREKPDETHMVKRPKKKTRGETEHVLVDDKFRYLNNWNMLAPIIRQAGDDVQSIRRLSVDRLIREEGMGIIETPLNAFEEKQGAQGKIYVPYPVKLEAVLESQRKEGSNQPTIIFGHGGQGKTILASEIANGFLAKKFEGYENYVPIVLNAGDISREAYKNENVSKDPGIEGIILDKIKCLEKYPLLRKEVKFVFLIDDYQKTGDYSSQIEETVNKLASEGHQVILFSRLERTDIYPPKTEGYNILQISESGIAEKNKDFLTGRIDSEDDSKKMEEYMEQYDSSITGYYLTKFFLVQIYRMGRGENSGRLEYIADERIKDLVNQGKPLSRTQLYEVQTDLICAEDIERANPGLMTKKGGRELIFHKAQELKQQLAELAYQQTFGEK